MSNTNFSQDDTQPNRVIQKERKNAMNLCPKCLKDDQVQKVSAIVTSGTITSTYQVPAQGEIAGHKVYGSVQQTGTSKTELAQILSMPSDKDWKDWKEKKISPDEMNKEYKRLHPETYGKEKNYGIKVGCMVLGFIGSVIGFLTLVSSTGNFQEGIYLSFCCCAFFPLSLVAAKIIYEVSNSKEHKQRFTAWNKSRVQEVNAQKAAIEIKSNATQRQAVSEFSRLYYCYRDDVVFIPDTDFCVDSSEMRNMYTWEKLGQVR